MYYGEYSSKMPGTDTAQVQLTSFSTGSHDNKPEKVDPVLKQEIEQLVNDLNHETAQYCTLSVALGGSQDTDDLREELKQIRRRAFDIAKVNKSKLIPVLQKNTICSDDVKHLERQFNMFSACLELLEIELDKTLVVQTKFPFYSGTKLLINTGATEAFHKCKSHIVTVETIETNCSEKQYTEKEDARNLERDICELHDFLYNINQTIAIEPWAVDQPTNNIKACNEYVNSKRSSQSSSGLTDDENNTRKKRCICVMLITFLAMLISASVIGVCLGLLQ